MEITFLKLKWFWRYRQQPSPLLYSIDIWPARNSRLAQCETNHNIARCTSMLAWSNIAGRSPTQLVVDLFAKHQSKHNAKWRPILSLRALLA